MPYSAFPVSKYDTEAAKVELCMGATGSKAGDPTPLAPAHAEDLTNLPQVHTLGHTSPVCSAGLGLLHGSTGGASPGASRLDVSARGAQM